MIRISVRIPKVLVFFAFLGLIGEPTVSGGEIGLRKEYREIGRMHSDSESIGSKIRIWQDEIFLDSGILKPLSFRYTENREKWMLAHPDGTRYFIVGLQRHIPKMTYQADDLKIDLTLPVVDVDAEDKLYSRIGNDTQDRFILPALIGRYQIANWVLQLGGWQENDFQPFNYFQYTLFILQTISFSADYQVLKDQFIKGDFRKIDRIYPEAYGLEKDEIRLTYRILNPLKIMDDFLWKEVSLQVVETQYANLNTNKADLTNQLKFKFIGLDHFLTHRLSYTNVVTTYHEGVYRYSLIETDQMKDDLWQEFEYAGFWRIPDSRFFLSWKYRIEDSLIENVILDQELQLQVVYTF